MIKLLGTFANLVCYLVFGFHGATSFVKSVRVQTTTWPSFLGLFEQGFTYLICLVRGTLPCASPAYSTALSVARYHYGMNVTWTYS